MSLATATFQLPDLHIRGRCCTDYDCCNPGNRVIINPPTKDEGPQIPTIQIKSTHCFSCCIKSDNEDENRRTWSAFQKGLEESYGKQAADAAFSTKNLQPDQVRQLGVPLRTGTYQELRELADLAKRNRTIVQEFFKWAQAKAQSERTLPHPSSPTSLLAARDTTDIVRGLRVQSPDGAREEQFNIEKLQERLRAMHLTKQLQSDDIRRITTMVLEDIALESKTVFTREEIRAKMIRYLKAADYDVEKPEFYEQIAPVALATLNKSVDTLDGREYAAFLQVAMALIAKKPSPKVTPDHPIGTPGA